MRVPRAGIAVCAVLAFAARSDAAGYGAREYSALAMGDAYAGASARDSDPSYLSYSPAALSGVSDWDVSTGLIGVWPTSDVSYNVARNNLGAPIGGDRTPDGFVQAAYIPNFSARLRLSPSWSAGFSVSGPWGLSTVYDRSWAGRYHGHETTLLTVDFMPAVAYQPTEDFTVAVAAQALYAKGLLSNAIDAGLVGTLLGVAGAQPGLEDAYGSFDAEDWGFGYMIGAQWAVSDALRLGVSYRSEVELRMTGPVTFSTGGFATGAALAGAGLLQNTRGATDLTTPAVASIGATLKVAPRWILAAEVAFTDWSVFEELRVEFANPLQPDEVTVFDWHDSWFASAGLTYQADGWAARGGVAFDQSPTGAARNARIPDADRVWLSLGADIALTERTKFVVSAAHIFVGPEPVNLTAATPSNVFRGDLMGTTDAAATTLGIGFTFR
jgi:long-chain fatty acid transport protein